MKGCVLGSLFSGNFMEAMFKVMDEELDFNKAIVMPIKHRKMLR